MTDIGLELKPSKTRISHTLEEVNGNKGFDFLGFTIRQFRVSKNQSGKNTNGKKLGFKTLIKPSKEKIRLHIKKLGEVIHKHKSSKQVALIRELNPIIRGWCNYYSAVCSKETFSKCDHIMYKQLKRWGERRHPNKNKGWVADKYWLTVGENNWKFSTKDGYKLYGHRETPIKRHIKVKGESSLYDGNLKYWATRMGKHPELSTRKAKLLKNQKGECKYCEAYFKEGDLIEIDHIIPKALGGKDEYKNVQLLHRHCHDKKTATDIKKMKEQKRACFHVKEVIREERIEVKVS